MCNSLVEGEHPVTHGDPEGAYTSDGPETTVILGAPLPNMLMCTVAEWSI